MAVAADAGTFRDVHGGETSACMQVPQYNFCPISTGLQNQKAVTAYFSRKQLLSFDFAKQNTSQSIHLHLPPSATTSMDPVPGDTAMTHNKCNV